MATVVYYTHDRRWRVEARSTRIDARHDGVLRFTATTLPEMLAWLERAGITLADLIED